MAFKHNSFGGKVAIALFLIMAMGLSITSCEHSPGDPVGPLFTDYSEDTLPAADPALTGTIRSTYTGQPVSGLSVQLTSREDASKSLTGMTDDAGNYVFDNLADGDYSITATLEGHEDYRAEITYAESPLVHDVELRGIPFYIEDVFYAPYVITAVGTGKSGLWLGQQVSSMEWEIHLYDPQNMHLLLSLPVDFRVSGLAQQGDILWVTSDASQDSVTMIDLSVSPPQILVREPLAASVYAGGIYWDGDRMFACKSSGGMGYDNAAIDIVATDRAFDIIESLRPPTAFPHSLVKVGNSYWCAASYPRGFYRLEPGTMDVLDRYVPPFLTDIGDRPDVVGQLTWSQGYFFGSSICSSVLYKMRGRW